MHRQVHVVELTLGSTLITTWLPGEMTSAGRESTNLYINSDSQHYHQYPSRQWYTRNAACHGPPGTKLGQWGLSWEESMT